jgi:hypothetical protein
MTRKDKGNRNELEAVKIYESAGYAVETPNYTRYQNSDYYNLFDFLAVRPDRLPVLGQVKSNKARGRPDWMDAVRAWFPVENFEFHFLTRYDREGWHLSVPEKFSDEPGAWVCVVDERGEDCDIGDYLRKHLE